MDERCKFLFDEDPNPQSLFDPYIHPLLYFFKTPETLNVPSPE
jgi:hypothetical protein